MKVHWTDTAEDHLDAIHAYIASLDELDDTENERFWLEEADRRYQEYKKGIIAARPAEGVLRDARSALR